MYIYNAKIHPMDSDVIENGYVKVENGIIAEVSAGVPEPVSESDINAEGMFLYPGFIDPHSHIGLIGNEVAAYWI